MRPRFIGFLALLVTLMLGGYWAARGVIERSVQRADVPYNQVVAWCVNSVSAALLAQGAPEEYIQSSIPEIWNECAKSLDTFLEVVDE